MKTKKQKAIINESTIEKAVCESIDIAAELKAYKEGNFKEPSCYQEILVKRIAYMTSLMEKWQEELEEIDYMAEAEKYI